MKKAPKPPDPYQLANAQSQSNIETAKAQQKIGMTGMSTPWANLSYETDPNSPSGYRAVGSNVGDPFHMEAGRAKALTDINHTLMDPMWAQRSEEQRSNLLNRGLREGSEGWATAMRPFDQSRDDAYNRMFLSSYDQANQAALTERNQPIAEMGALYGMNPSIPRPGVAPTDVEGPVMNNYNQQVAQSNAGMGGLFGLAATGLGGWARGGFPGASSIASGMGSLFSLSDRRLKTAITKVADDVRGWGIYLFKYLWDAATAPLRLGVMADEIAPIRPDAVREYPGGYMAVNYAALA